MNIRKLHHIWVKLRPINYWYFAILFLIFAVLSVFALRQNNLKMIELREEVFLADERGEGVEQALENLRLYVYGHMNTDLTAGNNAIRPPIQLTNTYSQLVEEEQERTAAVNKQVNSKAVEICEKRFGAGELRSGRVACVQEYVDNNSVKPKTIPKELYQFDFISPVWSPDLAGWSLVISGLFLVLFIARYLLELWFRNRLA